MIDCLSTAAGHGAGADRDAPASIVAELFVGGPAAVKSPQRAPCPAP